METIVTDSINNVADVTNMNDLREGMQINAVVKKIVNFGAFLDVGVGVDGLVHISKMSNKYVNDPSEIVSVGDTVLVKVIGIDVSNKKISLSMKDENEAPATRNSSRRESGYSDRNSSNNGGRFSNKNY